MVFAGTVIGRSRTAEIGQGRLIGGGPRQRHAAAVAALVHRVAGGVEGGRILQVIPRNIGHLKQAQFLALIDVCGTGQAELHQRGGTGTAGAEFAVLRVGGAVAQQPVVRQLVVGRALDLRQTVAGGAARHVVIVHDPRGGGVAGFGRRLEPGGDGLAELVGIPVGLREVEVEGLAQLVHRSVQVLVLGHHPRLGHGEARRIVFVEHLAPFAVDVVHLAAVEQRVAEVVVQHADHAVFAAELLQRLGFKVFGQAVRYVDAEAVGAVVGPEAQGLFELLVDVRILPVDVRLRLIEQVQIPLAVGHARPGRAAEEGLPVVGRQFAVLAAAVAEDVAVARRGAGLGGEGLLEEHVLVGGVVGHDVHDHFDAGLVRGLGHRVEVVHGA